MYFVIMGCGRVGSMLALSLEKHGHQVAVIDRDESAFRRLGPNFEGSRVSGIGFDRETLLRADIKRADAFAAVSSGDNSNILAARVARETFGVEHVVARIYDPGRAEVYERLGIPTVATVRWTSDQIVRKVLPMGALPEHTDASGKVMLAEIPPHSSWIGTPLQRIEEATGSRVAYLTRLGDGMVPESDSVFQEGDLLHLCLPTARVQQVEELLKSTKPVD
ncbi:potassium channel family protein [Flexivirga endophytica]|uniref:potassium channel family protein n=1 Tax=Flexivirga endophytica TaxID=1849103 RepID=UPI0016682FAA|nr:TrkA family potassium uptake protein [Flexivirga endophytica]